MKVVSNAYKETMNQVVRPTSQFQARLEMIDRGVETDSTITERQKAAFATSVFDKKHECDYILRGWWQCPDSARSELPCKWFRKLGHDGRKWHVQHRSYH